MMKHTNVLTFALTAVLVAACGGSTPQTYFSDVFNTMEDLYFPIVNNQNRVVVNYEVAAEITIDNVVKTYDAYFFTTGIKLVHTAPATNAGISTTRTSTIVYDYAEGGTFTKSVFANAPSQEVRTFSTFTNSTFSTFDRVVDLATTVLSEETKSIINNQATNLVIGGQPEDQDKKTYTLPIANFIDLGQFEDPIGFVPTSLEVVVSFTTSTNLGEFDITASGAGKNYQASITVSNPDGVVAVFHLLTSTQKETYTGYTA
jgi:hypothetical protein